MNQEHQAAKVILLELENGIGRFSSFNVSKEIRRQATALLNGTADIHALWARYAHYEEQGLVQGGPARSKVASADKRFLSRALRLIRGQAGEPISAKQAAELLAELDAAHYNCNAIVKKELGE